MKVKVIVLLTLLFCLCTSFLANSYISHFQKNRVDQHKDMVVFNDCLENEEGCSHLPIVSIKTKSEITSDPLLMTDAEFFLYYNEENSNRITDIALEKSKIDIRIRGNSSRSFDKHQYLLKFKKDNGNEKKVSLLGMEEENKWILNGPFLDKTQIRNYVAYNIAGKITDAVPEIRFVELYLNDNYQGLYTIIESVSRTLTNITSYKPKWANGMSSYILRMDRLDPNTIITNNFSKYTNQIIQNNAINVVYPSEDKLSKELLEVINKDFSKFEKALYSYDFDEYFKYIDIDSFVDYMIINEFFKNSDAGTHSTYVYKDVRGKIHMGPIWDFNNSADNYVDEVYSEENFLFQEKLWYDILLKNEKFVNKVINRYKYLRKNVLSNEYIQNYIDETVMYLGRSIDRNFKVWGYTFDERYTRDMLRPNDRNYRSYSEALEQYKEFLEDRGKWLDESIETLKQFCHYSINKEFVRDK